MSGLFDLTGKVALVTGGNSGIGREFALALRDAGATVAVGGRRADRNAAVIEELGTGHAAFALDVTDEASVESAVTGVVARLGRLDILVNNAGLANRKSIMELERRDWDAVIAADLTGPYLCTKHAARVMRKQGAGKIINIASVWGLVAPSKGLQPAYTAAKHGLIGLTKANAVELAPFGIQVNAIAPGFYITEMTAELKGTSFEAALIRRTPSGRLPDTSEIAGTCVYLASAASGNVSGTCIAVDGGYTASDGLDRG